jgi:hypothetical protein
VLTEEELGCLWIFLGLNVVELHLHLVVLGAFALTGCTNAAEPPNACMVHGIRIDEILFVHEKTQQFFLKLVIGIPDLILYDVLSLWLILNSGFVSANGVLVLFNEAFLCLEALDVGVGELGHDVLLNLINLFNLHTLELNQHDRTSDYRLMYSS